MNVLAALVLVSILAAVGFMGGLVDGLRPFIGVVVPYAAMLTFILGVAYRVLLWARAPVPFRIPTTCGQQRSLPWIKAARLENPSTTAGVAGRMALEVGLFRSLFRNTRSEIREGPRLVFTESKFLWLAAL